MPLGDPSAGGDDRGGTVLQGDPHQGRGRGQEDGIVRRSGLLEDSARLDACGAEVECLAAGQEEDVRGGVEGDDLSPTAVIDSDASAGMPSITEVFA